MTDMTDLGCQRLVTRRTGTGTPLSPVTSLEQCGRAAAVVVRSETGRLLAWACGRHESDVTDFAEELGLDVEVVA